MKQEFSDGFRWACRIASAVGVLLLGAGCNQSEPANALANWKIFSPPGGNFSVNMPPNPVEEIPLTKTGFEAKTFRIISAMSNLAGLAVGYSDQPGSSGFEKDPNKVLDSVRKKSIDDLKGELISEKPITLNNHTGREFLLTVKGGYTVRQRIYLANKRIYSQMVIAGSKGLESPEAKAFFNSFQILN